ncbi:MAG: hypothetical protein A4E62_02251 [Syntrophorhabdus sp. PtaU1.Bin002]|nr:MAG: hypothetical protein A4E62_02251 [Syntrophorhabdus sp. PtaU1.Bin002]
MKKVFIQSYRLFDNNINILDSPRLRVMGKPCKLVHYLLYIINRPDNNRRCVIENFLFSTLSVGQQPPPYPFRRQHDRGKGVFYFVG